MKKGIIYGALSLFAAFYMIGGSPVSGETVQAEETGAEEERVLELLEEHLDLGAI